MIVVHCAYVLYYLYVIFILSSYIAVALRSPILARCLEVHTVCRMQNGARKALRVRVINVAEIMSLPFRCCGLTSDSDIASPSIHSAARNQANGLLVCSREWDITI